MILQKLYKKGTFIEKTNKTETTHCLVQNDFLHLKESLCILYSHLLVLAVVTMTQTCHDALAPNRAKRESEYSPSPAGNSPRAAFSIHHTITKWIFDLDWCSYFLSSATPWRTKQFSCYPWTVRTTLNSTPQHLGENRRPAGSQVLLVQIGRRKVESNTNFE